MKFIQVTDAVTYEKYIINTSFIVSVEETYGMNNKLVRKINFSTNTPYILVTETMRYFNTLLVD